MSPAAIDARLRRGAQLYRLAQELAAAKPVGRLDRHGNVVPDEGTPPDARPSVSRRDAR